MGGPGNRRAGEGLVLKCWPGLWGASHHQVRCRKPWCTQSGSGWESWIHKVTSITHLQQGERGGRLNWPGFSLMFAGDTGYSADFTETR